MTALSWPLLGSIGEAGLPVPSARGSWYNSRPLWRPGGGVLRHARHFAAAGACIADVPARDHRRSECSPSSTGGLVAVPAWGRRGTEAPQGATGNDDFEAFVREQRPLLVGYLCRRLPEEDAKDIAQEAMMRLMRYRDLPTDQLRRLVYRIAANALLDRGRRVAGASGPGQPVSLGDAHDWLASPEPSHEQRIETQQQLAHVRRLILQLPDRCREVYLLNRIEGMSYPQIAERFGISVKAVEKHVSRALRGLRDGVAELERDAAPGSGS